MKHYTKHFKTKGYVCSLHKIFRTFQLLYNKCEFIKIFKFTTSMKSLQTYETQLLLYKLQTRSLQLGIVLLVIEH